MPDCAHNCGDAIAFRQPTPTMQITLFFVCACATMYSYFGYPLVLQLLPRARRLAARSAAAPSPVTTLPRMALIITAHNEAGRIARKLDNTLAIDYPRELLQVIVASDCSDDSTDDIVRSFAQHGVTLVRAEVRLGKENAQGCAITAARADILVFSDVATEIPANGLRQIAAAFAQSPDIGAVSSEDRFLSEGGKLVGEGAYVRYEMWLRRLESERAGLVGMSGSFFAARRRVCAEWDIHAPSDFNTALNCARHGMVAVSSPDVLGFYRDVQDPALEYRRKLRTVLRGITAIARHPEVLRPGFGTFAFQVWSHKIMRWLVPWLLIATLALNAALTGTHWFFGLTLLGQIAFYAIALGAHLVPTLREPLVPRLIYFFVQVNVAIAHATVQFLRGRRMSVWAPTAR